MREIPQGLFEIESFSPVPKRSGVERVKPKPLPPLNSERLIERIAEAMQVGLEPAKFRRFPLWTQRVMLILKDQFVPREFVTILSAGESVFAEGVAVAWVAKGRDFIAASDASSGRFARDLVERLATAAKVQDAVARVESGEFTASAEFQRHVMDRLFVANFSERRAFAEGLAIGNRLHELLDRQAKRNTTDATGIYLMLWFYWPEISQLKSVGEVARVLAPSFAGNNNLAGSNWDERIRKLANRLGLSFRAKQNRTRRRVDR